MSLGPPGADGGFFAAPIAPQQPLAYGPPSRAVPTPPPALPQLTTADGPPPWVVSAVTSLVIAGIAALWAGMTMLTVVSTFGGDDGGTGVQFRGAFLLLNGLVDLPLAYLLLRGVEQARWAVTAVCGWWLLYWLFQVTRATKAFSQIGLAPAGFGFGRLTFLAAVGLLLLAAWAGITGAVLWLSRSQRHFTTGR